MSDAAAALLGALLIDPEAVGAVRVVVSPDDFPTPSGRDVYAAVLALDDRGVAVDFVTVAEELERRGTLERVGRGNLIALVNRCPSSLHAAHYARLVAEAADRRRLPGASGLPAGAMTW